MEEGNDYLKFIYHEDLYIIDEPDASQEVIKETIQEKEDQADSEIPTPTIEEPKPIRYFGGNEKGILILVNDPSNDFLNQNDLDLLMKIVESGLRFSKNDFALVNVANNQLDQVLDEIEYNHLIAFGLEGSAVTADQSLYQTHNIDGNKALFSESLSVLAKDQSKKMQLWKALKSMFNI